MRRGAGAKRGVGGMTGVGGTAGATTNPHAAGIRTETGATTATTGPGGIAMRMHMTARAAATNAAATTTTTLNAAARRGEIVAAVRGMRRSARGIGVGVAVETAKTVATSGTETGVEIATEMTRNGGDGGEKRRESTTAAATSADVETEREIKVSIELPIAKIKDDTPPSTSAHHSNILCFAHPSPISQVHNQIPPTSNLSSPQPRSPPAQTAYSHPVPRRIRDICAPTFVSPAR